MEIDCKLNEDERVKLINSAKHQIIYVMVGVFKEEAKALEKATKRLGSNNVKIILDYSVDSKSIFFNFYLEGLKYIIQSKHKCNYKIEQNLNHYFAVFDDDIYLISNINMSDGDVAVFKCKDESVIKQQLECLSKLKEAKIDEAIEQYNRKYIINYVKNNVKIVCISFSGTRIGNKEINLSSIIKESLSYDQQFADAIKKQNLQLFGDKENELKKMTNYFDNKSKNVKDAFTVSYEKNIRLIAEKEIDVFREKINEILINGKSKVDINNLQDEVNKCINDFMLNSRKLLKKFSIKCDNSINEKIYDKISKFEKIETLLDNIGVMVLVFDISIELLNDDSFINELCETLIQSKNTSLRKIGEDIKKHKIIEI